MNQQQADTRMQLEELFKEFDEEDETGFGKYDPGAMISKDIFLFTLWGHEYMSRIIYDGRFKVIIEAIAEDIPETNKGSHFLSANETLVYEGECKEFAIQIAVMLMNVEPPSICTGEDLLMYGFKKL